MKPTLRFADFPPRVGELENPYRPLIDRALAARFDVERTEFHPTREWAHRHAPGLVMVHLHWPEDLWRRGDQTADEAAVAELAGALDVCRQLGVRIVWTVHNHRHHDGLHASDELGYRLLATTVDLVVCHSHWSAEWVRATYGRRGRIIVMPIGSFGSVHPAGRASAVVAVEVGLDPNRPIVVCAGQMRPYKGLDTAVDACRSASGAWQLLLVGRPGPRFDLDRLHGLIADDTNVAVIAEHVGDARFGELLAIADVALLPYADITGSSVPPAAWAHGTPIIASRLPYFEEVLSMRANLGSMFTEGDAADLGRVIAEVLNWPAQQVAADLAAHDASLEWGVVTRQFVRLCGWWVLTRPLLRQSKRAVRLIRRMIRRGTPAI